MSKRVANANAKDSTVTSSARAGPVQVFFNGKMVTPQSLIPRKSHGTEQTKKSKVPILKPQTIDEAIDPTERTSSALKLKRYGIKQSTMTVCPNLISLKLMLWFAYIHEVERITPMEKVLQANSQLLGFRNLKRW